MRGPRPPDGTVNAGCRDKSRAHPPFLANVSMVARFRSDHARQKETRDAHAGRNRSVRAPLGSPLSLMLQRRGIEFVIVGGRGRQAIEATIRAGILEQSTVDLMAKLGVVDRLRREAVVHDGTLLRFGGWNHRIDFKALDRRPGRHPLPAARGAPAT